MTTVFTKIINEEIPGRFVYRSDNVVAFLTIEPLQYGHCLVVPVKEVDRWTDLPASDWAELNAVAQRIGQAVIKAFGSARVGYIIAGFDVPHTHIHVFPTNQMADYDFKNALPMDGTDPAKMDDAQQRIIAALAEL